ncbi:Uncharacterised protein [Mycobacteroides abscessus subsp. abscessus]|nr:Uncharacterised protein [Mycobacteroides abscessus subsp. abscessus]
MWNSGIAHKLTEEESNPHGPPERVQAPRFLLELSTPFGLAVVPEV